MRLIDDLLLSHPLMFIGSLIVLGGAVLAVARPVGRALLDLLAEWALSQRAERANQERMERTERRETDGQPR